MKHDGVVYFLRAAHLEDMLYLVFTITKARFLIISLGFTSIKNPRFVIYFLASASRKYWTTQPNESDTVFFDIFSVGSASYNFVLLMKYDK